MKDGLRLLLPIELASKESLVELISDFNVENRYCNEATGRQWPRVQARLLEEATVKVAEREANHVVRLRAERDARLAEIRGATIAKAACVPVPTVQPVQAPPAKKRMRMSKDHTGRRSFRSTRLLLTTTQGCKGSGVQLRILSGLGLGVPWIY